MIPEWLSRYLEAHPDSEEEDVRKVLFQSMFGNGHLLADAASVQTRITTEMADGGPDRGEPLTEEIGSFLRLNLRPARDAGLTPEWVTEMVRTSGFSPAVDRSELCDAVRDLDPLPGMDMDRLARLCRELADQPGALPSHSDRVHRVEDPRYRLIDAAWGPVLPILTALAKIPEGKPRLITIDGRCGSGKSTLAAALKRVLSCPVLHTDDFVIPHAMKTPERLAVPGGNEDVDRIEAEVLEPFRNGAALHPRRYNWYTDAYEQGEPFPACDLLILEGSYGNLPPIRQEASLRVFLTISPEDQWRRLEKRNSPQALEGFRDRWIPLEEAYLTACGLPDAGCLCLEAMSLRLDRVLRNE